MKRKYKPVKNYPGIYRVLVSHDGTTWTEPARGSTYAASRYEKGQQKKRSKKHFASFDEAKAFRAKQETLQISMPTQESPALVVPTTQKSFTFEDAVLLYETSVMSHRAPTTRARYPSYKKHLQFFEGMAVESIDTITIDNWYAWLKRPEYLATQHDTRCSYKSETTVMRNILAAYRSRINRNYPNPFIKDHTAAMKVKEGKLVVKDLTPDEFRRFLDALKDVCMNTKREYVYYVALLQYFTYSRIQDVTALCCEDFDFARKQITVRHKLQFGRSKDETTKHVDGAKKGIGKVIPMSDLAAHAFKEWTMRSGIRSGPLFFLNGSWSVYRHITYRYNKALKQAGINQSATHVLRHASLTEAQATLKDLNQTKILAGHSSIKTTERYAKVRHEDLQEGQKLIDQKMSEALHGSQRFANEPTTELAQT